MIQVKELGKSYGAHPALRGVTLAIEAGDMFGLIGPNGAGKTTLIRILATLLQPSAGTASVNGHDVTRNAQAVRREIGYMPDFFGVYEELKVREYLEFFAATYGIRGPKRKATVDGVLELTDLTAKRDALIASLSRGMQQRLGLARVLVHDPKVLFLDEPASGLDPRARIEIRALLKELRNMGKTILISSHILADLADLCNKIGLIERGRLLYAGGLKEAMAQVQGDDVWLVEVFEDADRAKKVLEGQAFTESVTLADGLLRIKLRPGYREVHAIPQILLQQNLRLKMFRVAEVTLEDAFLKLTKGEVS
ncbi:MAG TPA: ABC transporter ATP-binding protein [Planctomycetota bacterium]|nr:ABC transporter ATP-binding protein [Planctomycetota bacterium]